MYEILEGSDKRIEESDVSLALAVQAATENGEKRIDGYFPDILVTFITYEGEHISHTIACVNPLTEELYEIMCVLLEFARESHCFEEWLSFIQEQGFEAYTLDGMLQLMRN